jgi:hypothetical protein
MSNGNSLNLHECSSVHEMAWSSIKRKVVVLALDYSLSHTLYLRSAYPENKLASGSLLHTKSNTSFGNFNYSNR